MAWPICANLAVPEEHTAAREQSDMHMTAWIRKHTNAISYLLVLRSTRVLRSTLASKHLTTEGRVSSLHGGEYSLAAKAFRLIMGPFLDCVMAWGVEGSFWIREMLAHTGFRKIGLCKFQACLSSFCAFCQTPRKWQEPVQEMYVYAGLHDAGDVNTFYDELYMYTPSSNAWTQRASSLARKPSITERCCGDVRAPVSALRFSLRSQRSLEQQPAVGRLNLSPIEASWPCHAVASDATPLRAQAGPSPHQARVHVPFS